MSRLASTLTARIGDSQSSKIIECISEYSYLCTSLYKELPPNTRRYLPPHSLTGTLENNNKGYVRNVSRTGNSLRWRLKVSRRSGSNEGLASSML